MKTKKLGYLQKDCLEYATKHWQGFNKDSETVRVIKSLEKRGLIVVKWDTYDYKLV